MPEVLSPIERRIYVYLVDYLKRETYQPSIREIGSRFGIRSTKTVTEHLQSLQRKGYLDRTPSRSRALKIIGLDLSPDTYTVPLYSGGNQDALAEVEARFDLDRSFGCSPDCFFVRVAGDHLSDAGILDGDLILVEPRRDLQEGDVAVFDRNGVVDLGDSRSDNPLQGDRTGDSGNDGNGSLGRELLGVARSVIRTFRNG
ncbi:MAG: S24 family peptidase [Gemmatimonadota bacterium]